MTKNDLELDVIITSKYCEIIVDILRLHKSLSINKTLVFSYINKKMAFNNSFVYTASNKKNVLLKCLSLLTGNFDDYCGNVKYILNAIHLLSKNEIISIHINEIIFIEDGKLYEVENTFLNNAIMDSKRISDKQFMKEVIKNV
jgi:hypothetical protein